MAEQAKIEITVTGEDVESKINGDRTTVMYGLVYALASLYDAGHIPEKLVDDLPILIRTKKARENES